MLKSPTLEPQKKSMKHIEENKLQQSLKKAQQLVQAHSKGKNLVDELLRLRKITSESEN